MKKLIITAITLILLGNVKGQEPSYESVLAETLNQYENVKTNEELQQVASRFERISQVEGNRWEAFYYLAFLNIQLSFREKDGDKKDAILDEAQKSIDKALELGGNKSELYTLQGFLYQGRLQVSVMMRGAKYSSMANEVLEKAIAENPENPRAYYLLGQNSANMPKMFGGGCKVALPNFEKAKTMFDMENGDKGIYPKWGAKSNERILEKCRKELGKS